MMKGRKIGNSAGFTLVEVVVTGAIALFVFGVIIGVINFFNSEVKLGTLRALIQRNCDVVTQDIGNNVRASLYVLQDGETVSQVTLQGKLDSVNCQLINLLDQNGIVWKKFRISSGKLQEWTSATDWRDYTIGTQTVTLSTSATANRFHLTASRKNVSLYFAIKALYKNFNDSLKVDGEMYSCRP